MGMKAMRDERMKRMVEKDHHEMKKKEWNLIILVPVPWKKIDTTGRAC